MFINNRVLLNLDSIYNSTPNYSILYSYISNTYLSLESVRYSNDIELDFKFTSDFLFNLVYRSLFLKSKFILVALNPNYYTAKKAKSYPHFQIYRDVYSLSLRRVQRALDFLEKQNMIEVNKGGRIYKVYKGTDQQIIHQIKSYDPAFIEKNGAILYVAKASLTKVTMKPFTEWEMCKSMKGWDLIRFILNQYNFPKINTVHNPIKDHKDCMLLKFRGVICVDKTRDIHGRLFLEKKSIRNKSICKLMYRSNESEENILNAINSAILASEAIPEDMKWAFLYTRQFGKRTKINGRFYSLFNRIKKEYRKLILDLIGYVEVDMKNTNLNILWRYETGNFYYEEFDTDFYSDLITHTYHNNAKISPKQLAALRPIYKTIMLAMLGSDNYGKYRSAIWKILLDAGCVKPRNSLTRNKLGIRNNSLSPSQLWYKYLTDHGFDTTIKYPRIKFIDIVNGILSFCGPILYLLYNDATRLCMNIESRMIEKVMMQSIKDGFLPLSIHDCICVPHSDSIPGKYNDLMRSILKAEIEARPKTNVRDLSFLP